MDRNNSTNRVTIKGIVLGAFLAGFAAWWAGYGEMIIHSTPLSNDHSAPVALFLFFIVTALINPALGLIRPAWKLGRGDLITIFILVLTSAAIPTRGFVSMIGPVVTGAKYYADDTNRWNELVVPHVGNRKWLVPQGEKVAEHYYEGLPEGEGIPWRGWARPLVFWMSMCLAFTLFSLCIASILRKQWVERERIIYPLMQLPMELAASGDSTKSILKSHALWIGFAIPLVALSYKGLAFYHPEYLDRAKLLADFQMFNSSSHLRLRVSPISIGLLYFVRTDMLVGLALFPCLLSIGKGFMISTGTYPQVSDLGIWSYDAVEAFFGAGILFVFVARIIYFARRHLRDVAATAVGLAHEDDSNEILSYRFAVLGLLGSGAYMVVWLYVAGVAVWQACLYLVLAFTIFLALARVIAEAGLPTALPPMVAGDFITGVVGVNSFSAQNLTGLGFTYPFHAEMRCFVLSHASNGIKAADEGLTGSKKNLLWGMLLAVSVSFIVAMFLMIYFPYRDGGLNLSGFTFRNTAKYSWMDASQRILRADGPQFEGLPLMLAGALLMTGLLLCAHWIPAWPVNPGALVVSFHWAGQVLWPSAVFALTIKSLILKYGGIGTFRKSRPFFFGLILGEVFTAAVWVIIDGITGKHNNYLTSFF